MDYKVWHLMRSRCVGLSIDSISNTWPLRKSIVYTRRFFASEYVGHIAVESTLLLLLQTLQTCSRQVLELRGDSFQHFGNAAIVQSIVDRLPDIAREIAAPLAKTDKVRNV